MKNPFAVLGVADDADDAAIKKAYLQQVRLHPPERDPERFQTIRGAFEAIQTQRDRLRYRLFQQETPDLEGLVAAALRPGSGQRPGEQQFQDALAELLSQTKS